jgi:hypothetical protein
MTYHSLPLILHFRTYHDTQGFYHTGVQIDGVEYAFGQGVSGTGVWMQRPKELRGEVTFDKQLFIGNCSKTRAERHDIVETMKVEYQAQSYSLVSRNCNHFTNDLCQRLCGKV